MQQARVISTSLQSPALSTPSSQLLCTLVFLFSLSLFSFSELSVALACKSCIRLNTRLRLNLAASPGLCCLLIPLSSHLISLRKGIPFPVALRHLLQPLHHSLSLRLNQILRPALVSLGSRASTTLAMARARPPEHLSTSGRCRLSTSSNISNNRVTTITTTAAT